jgi:hypothetical protein
MLHRKHIHILVIAIVFLCLITGTGGCWLATSSGYIWRLGIKLDITGYKKISFSQDRSVTAQVEKLQLGKGTTNVFIDKTIIQNHEKYITDRQFIFTSLFLPTTSPYPGVITNIVECAEEFQPKKELGAFGIIYRVPAGERFNYGICSSDLIRYSSMYGIFDCGTKGVIEIRVFSLPQDRQKIEDLLSSFRC